MSQLIALVNTFRRNEEGQDLLEYALLVALIALVAVGAVTAAGTSNATPWTSGDPTRGSEPWNLRGHHAERIFDRSTIPRS